MARPWLDIRGTRGGVLAILGGTAVGQVVGLIAAPLLSRIYSPHDFGVFAIASALTVTLGTVAAGRFELAVPLPRTEDAARALVLLGLLASTVTALVGLLAVALFGQRIAGAYEQPDLLPWLWLVPVGAAAMGAFLTMSQWAIRQKKYPAIARRNVMQSTVLVLTQLGLGAAGLGPGGLVIGFVLGQVAGVLSLVSGALRSWTPQWWRGTHADVVRTAHRYRRFPLVLGPAGMLNVLGLQLPLLLISLWYGGQVAGWLGMTQRVLTLPVSLVGVAVSQVYVGELARSLRGNRHEAMRLFRRASSALLAVAVPIVVTLAALGPHLFSIVFGARWEVSGHYARGLAIALGAQLIAAPLSITLVALEKQTLQLVWDAARVVILFVVIAASASAGASAQTVVWLVGAASAALYAVAWAMSRSCIRATVHIPPPEARGNKFSPS